jgi:hypothetical protein
MRIASRKLVEPACALEPMPVEPHHSKGAGSMKPDDALCFDVYVRTRTAVVTLVREVSLRTAHVLARHHADTRGHPVFIRNCATSAVVSVGPSAARRT